MRTPVMAHPNRGTRKWRAASFGAALAIFSVFPPAGTSASTRDELDRLSAQMAQVVERLARVEAQQASVQKALLDISARIEALSRASQTADIRADLDILKRQVEALASRTPSPGNEAHRPQPPSPQIPHDPVRTPPPEAPPPQAAARPGSEEIYSQAHRDYLAGRYELAASQFRQFLEAYPSDPKAPNAQYWTGECLYSQKRFAEALEAFQAVLQLFPGSAKGRAAQLKSGLCLLAEGEPRKGRQILEALVEEDPGSDEAQIARERLDRLPPP